MKQGDGDDSESPKKFIPQSNEDVIPVIHVGGVYFPTQRLRVKLSDNMAKIGKIRC
jgi:hypothetical protein